MYGLRPGSTDMYFVRSDPRNKEHIEMSFDLTQYQVGRTQLTCWVIFVSIVPSLVVSAETLSLCLW